ncbi:MAG: DUF962 domain-containing protein [Betaproteobacteria bacterium]|nr:DUF962 domain-containing protein [Betaproteobacteria bacterium]
MKPLDAQMSVYAAYHRNRWCKLTHFIGVPAIVLAIPIPLFWVQLGAGVTLAHVIVGMVLLYYFMLDIPLALGMTLCFAAVLYIAGEIAGMGTGVAWTWFAVLFVGGWIIQFVGHAFEGRRPALVDNIWQIFMAPIFLLAEAGFTLGWKTDLRDKIESRLQLGAIDARLRDAEPPLRTMQVPPRDVAISPSDGVARNDSRLS